MINGGWRLSNKQSFIAIVEGFLSEKVERATEPEMTSQPTQSLVVQHAKQQISRRCLSESS